MSRAIWAKLLERGHARFLASLCPHVCLGRDRGELTPPRRRPRPLLHGQNSVHAGVDGAGRSPEQFRVSSRKGGGGRRAADGPARHPPEARAPGGPVGAGARRPPPRVRTREPAALPALHPLASARVFVAAAIFVFFAPGAGRVRRARFEGVRHAQFEAQGTSPACIAAWLARPLLIGSAPVGSARGSARPPLPT